MDDITQISAAYNDGPPLQVVVSKTAPIRGFGILATPKGVVSQAIVTKPPLKGLTYTIPSSRLSVSVWFLIYERICSSLRPTVST